MTKKLRFTKAEIDNAAKIAVEHGVSVKLLSDGSMIIEPVNNKDSRDNEDAPVDEIIGGLL